METTTTSGHLHQCLHLPPGLTSQTLAVLIIKVLHCREMVCKQTRSQEILRQACKILLSEDDSELFPEKATLDVSSQTVCETLPDESSTHSKESCNVHSVSTQTFSSCISKKSQTNDFPVTKTYLTSSSPSGYEKLAVEAHSTSQTYHKAFMKDRSHPSDQTQEVGVQVKSVRFLKSLVNSLLTAIPLDEQMSPSLGPPKRRRTKSEDVQIMSIENVLLSNNIQKLELDGEFDKSRVSSLTSKHEHDVTNNETETSASTAIKHEKDHCVKTRNSPPSSTSSDDDRKLKKKSVKLFHGRPLIKGNHEPIIIPLNRSQSPPFPEDPRSTRDTISSNSVEPQGSHSKTKSPCLLTCVEPQKRFPEAETSGVSPPKKFRIFSQIAVEPNKDNETV
ncbi:uncharacterized protein LOC111088480 [Limulus polyphemus]|uniref:Uncharacterized protein LOC111088480 n=1 Tax=Limulus polyphemus TaxID=6850 RepID=A0ABM1TEX8_LIMPO|nr:uncharacterized protein LOC111088480 [Limulus polyphemus]XP_022254434.1 uncharacterized protein LOC111088480 [Limulus polyphemus]